MRKAFTLIELLGVVLIIGILSAIALPQYTKAVEKARISEIKIAMKNVLNASSLYGLSSGECSNNMENFDWTMPGECSTTEGHPTYCNTKYFSYHIDECAVILPGNPGEGIAIQADRIGGNYRIWLNGSTYETSDDAKGIFICDSINGDMDVDCPEAGATKNADGYWVF